MRILPTLIVAAALLASTAGCYHAQITTGKPASDKVVEKKWHVGFVHGLVIPEDLDVAEDCPDGVAMVETQLSFMNQLVTVLTGGIFSPMMIRVTCAAGGSSADAYIIRGSDIRALIAEASVQSLDTEAPVLIALSTAD